MRFATHLTAQHPRRRRESQSPTRTQQSREPSLRTQVFMRNISRLSQANLYACAAKHESTIGRRGRQAMSRPSSTVDHLPLDKQGDDGHRLVSTRASSRGKFRSSAETKDQQNISSSQKKTQSREEAGKALGSKTAVGRVTRGIVRMDAHRGSCQQEQSSVPRKRKLQDPIVPPAKRSRGPFAIEDIRPAMIRRLASKSSGQHPSIAKYGGLSSAKNEPNPLPTHSQLVPEALTRRRHHSSIRDPSETTPYLESDAIVTRKNSEHRRTSRSSKEHTALQHNAKNSRQPSPTLRFHWQSRLPEELDAIIAQAVHRAIEAEKAVIDSPVLLWHPLTKPERPTGCSYAPPAFHGRFAGRPIIAGGPFTGFRPASVAHAYPLGSSIELSSLASRKYRRSSLMHCRPRAGEGFAANLGGADQIANSEGLK